jgi:plastocyanin
VHHGLRRELLVCITDVADTDHAHTIRINVERVDPEWASGLGSNAFNPNPVTVSIGTTLTWTNQDSVPHTSTSDARGWQSGSLSPGAHFDFTFQSAGTLAEGRWRAA